MLQMVMMDLILVINIDQLLIPKLRNFMLYTITAAIHNYIYGAHFK